MSEKIRETKEKYEHNMKILENMNIGKQEIKIKISEKLDILNNELN